MNRLTASKLGLARHCLWPWASGIEWPQSTTSAEASLGVRFHSTAEQQVLGSTDLPVDADVAPLLAHCSKLISELQCCHCKTEQGVWYNNKSAGLLDCSEHRDYSAAVPEALVGTADLIYEDERPDGDRCLVVADWKTGQQQHLGSAVDNAQLRFFAAALYTMYDCNRLVSVALFHVTPSGLTEDIAHLDHDELCDCCFELEQLQERLASGAHDPAPGMHCTEHYCPCIAQCPAIAKDLAVVAPDLTAAITSPQHCGELVGRLAAAQKALEHIEAAIKAYAAERGGVPLPDGRTWGPSEVSRETIQLTRSGYDTVLAVGAEDAVSMSMSKATIMSAMGPTNGAKLLDALRDLGCVSSSSYQRFAARGKKRA